jgi:DNA-binding response OmpR family regulator
LDSRHLLAQDGLGVKLTNAEFNFPRVLVKSPNGTLSRHFLLDQLHRSGWGGFNRGVDGFVSPL